MYMYVGALVGATGSGGRGNRIRQAFGPTTTTTITASAGGTTVV